MSLDPVLVAASRSPESAQLPVARYTLTADDLASFPAVALDDALRADPAFSLFRRTSSLSSNPTSQGVSLRGIGPSGASRSLVLLDSVPLNDPFGGWVQWSEVPRLELARVDLDHGGGSGLWGNAALGGTITLYSAAPAPDHGSAQTEAGSFGTRSGEVAAAVPLGHGNVSFDGAAFATDGFYALAPGTRGAVDRPLNSDHQVAQVAVNEALAPGVTATATARLFDESRGNGTALQANTTKSSLASVALAGAPHPGFGWTVTGYAQTQRYTSVFSAVSADRSTETPSNDQYAVPATAVGLATSASWVQGANVTLVGADVRQVVGETREDFQYAAGAFTRVRFAGGAQDFGGGFVHHEHRLAADLTVSLDLRMDHWENRQGHDREYTLATGSPTLLSTYPTKTGNEFDPDLGLVWKPSSDLKVRTNLTRAFRLPTLNEYYRPFRVGTVTTTANPFLVPETLTGAEVGTDYGRGPWSVGATAFADDLRHGVGNITIAQSASGTTVQRQNLDRVSIRGLEASLRWKPTARVEARLGYLLDQATVVRADAQPQLDGLRLPEVPRQTLSGSLALLPFRGFRLESRVRWVSLQFDDDLNTLRLPGATTVDLEISQDVNAQLQLYLAAENVLNARVITAESTAGLYSYDAPALVRAGLRLHW